MSRLADLPIAVSLRQRWVTHRLLAHLPLISQVQAARAPHEFSVACTKSELLLHSQPLREPRSEPFDRFVERKVCGPRAVRARG